MKNLYDLGGLLIRLDKVSFVGNYYVDQFDKVMFDIIVNGVERKIVIAELLGKTGDERKTAGEKGKEIWKNFQEAIKQINNENQ
jgi:hypothetical protein